MVIAGSGSAGLAAAIEVLQAGSSAVIYESQKMIGGSTVINGGILAGQGTRKAKELGINVTTEEVVAWFEESAVAQTLESGEPVPEILQMLAERGGETIDWLEENGVVIQAVGIVLDYSPLEVIHFTGTGGNLVTPLREKIEGLGGEIITGARVSKLYQNDEGRVIGVRVDSGSKSTNIKAKRAVVLATGGYASNPEMLAQLTPTYSKIKPSAAPGCQGDALVMASELGAITRRTANPPILFPTVEVTSNSNYAWYVLEDGGIVVGLDAQRFMNEGLDYVTGDTTRAILAHMNETGDEYYWMITQEGEKLHQTLVIFPANVVYADTVEELAAQIDLDPAALKESVEKWNAAVDSGVDSEFGRDEMMKKIDTPPFVAAQVRPQGAATVGGIHTDVDAHALTWASMESGQLVEKIPGLYAAGEVAGWNARGGWSVTSYFMMGRIAGQNAAKEEPWS